MTRSADTFRALILADVHLSSKLPHARQVVGRADGHTDRLDDIENVLAVAAAHARDNDVNAVFVLGDLLDRSEVDGPTGAAVVRALCRFHCPVYVGPGNHEARSPRGGPFCTAFLGALPAPSPVVWMSNEQGWSLLPFVDVIPSWIRFTWLDYASVDTWRERRDAARAVARAALEDGLPEAQHAVMLLHQSIIGGEDDGWTCDDGLDADVDFDGWDEAIGGHFHNRQSIGVFRFVGSSSHLGFGDEPCADRGFEVSTWTRDATGAVEVESDFYTVEQPRFFLHRTGVDGADDAAAFLTDIDDDNYVRIIVGASHAAWVAAKSSWEAMIEPHRARLRWLELTHEPAYHGAGAAVPRIETKGHTLAGLVRAYLDAGVAVVAGLDEEALLGEGLAFVDEASEA